MNLLRPYKTLGIGVLIGAVLWPMVRGRLGSPGA